MNPLRLVVLKKNRKMKQCYICLNFKTPFTLQVVHPTIVPLWTCETVAHCPNPGASHKSFKMFMGGGGVQITPELMHKSL